MKLNPVFNSENFYKALILLYICIILILVFNINDLLNKNLAQKIHQSEVCISSERIIYPEDTLHPLYEELRKFKAENKKLIQENLKLKQENECLNQELICLTSELYNLKKNPISWIKKNYTSHNLRVTAYSPSVDECDDTPFIAASGKSVADWTIAVSQNMRKDGWGFGKFVYIPELDQFFKINDVMNKRYKKNLDIFKWTKKEAKKFGSKNLEVYLVNN